METINLQGCFLLFAVSCIAGTFFILFMVDETKGKVMETIATEEEMTTFKSIS